MSVWNFAFGSHMVGERMTKAIGSEPQKSLQAILPDHRRTFWKANKFPMEAAELAAKGGFPVLMPARGQMVHGVAYLISNEQLEGLDKSEGQFGYKRIALHVDATGVGSIQAFAHNRPDSGEFLPPSPEFLDLMLQGLREHGYSAGIIGQVGESARTT